jgi:hypothetical protein
LANYLFSKSKPVNSDPTTVDAFTNIVWKANKKVGFAFRDNVAVLAYSTLAVDEKTCWASKKGAAVDPATTPPTHKCGAEEKDCKAAAGCKAFELGYKHNVE